MTEPDSGALGPLAPVDHVLRLDKQTAAARQTEAAIEAFARGFYEVAITLAGAAEGMLTDGQAPSAFSRLVTSREALERFGKKDWITILNHERDWLKHRTENDEPAIELTIDEAAFMIARALSKISIWSSPTERFKVWHMDHLERRSRA